MKDLGDTDAIFGSWQSNGGELFHIGGCSERLAMHSDALDQLTLQVK